MEQLNNLSVIKSEKAIGDIEKVISIVGGAYLLYDALKREKKSIPEIAAAGFMIYRGVKGFLKDYDTGNLMGKPAKHTNSNINIHGRLIVKRPINEVYNFWRHLGNLPLFMDHLEGVTVLSDTLSEWKVRLPGLGNEISWKAEIVAEEPHRFIGWRSLPGGIIKHAGKVEFKDAGELGTLVHIVFSYQAPLGHTGEEIARVLNPVFEKMVRKDVMGFKRYMETGTTEKLQQETVAIFT
ncbi:MAG: SRPBCC family protein [Bacteroidota bacterium]